MKKLRWVFAAVVIAATCFGVTLSTGMLSLPGQPGGAATQTLPAAESLTSEDAAQAAYTLAETYSDESLAAFADVMHITNGEGDELSLGDLPQGSYSGFLFSLTDAAFGSGDASALVQQAVDQGIVEQIHDSLYRISSLDDLAGILDASKLDFVQPDYTMQLVGKLDDSIQFAQAVQESASDEGAGAAVADEGNASAASVSDSVSLFDTTGGTAQNPAPLYPPSDPYYLSGNLWNMDMLNISGAWELGLDGDVYVYNGTPVKDSPVRVAVIDTGFYGTGAGETHHEDFNYDNVVDGYNFATSAEGTPDDKGHGTFVSGLIAAQVNNGVGVAGAMPGVSIVPCKVFDSGNAKTSDVIAAIYYAVDDAHVDVINMSLGGEYNESALEAACEYAVEQGVLVVASAGNDGVSTPNYPAAYDCVVGVASVDSNKARSSWSQYGKSVFVTAPGEQVTSTYNESPTSYTTASGTSFSGPEVAALGAMCKSVYPDITQDIFKNLLIETSTDLGAKGYDDYYGYGLVNFQTMAQSVLASQTLPWYNLAFSVTNAEGEAIDGATVELTAAQDISWDADAEAGFEAGSIAAGAVVSPEEDGTFRVHRGLYNYAVSADGYYLASGKVKTYAENQQVDVQMEHSHVVTLSVTDSQGTPLSDVHVAVYSSTGRTEVSETLGAGKLEYNLMPGVYSYEAAAQGYVKVKGSFTVQREDRNLSVPLYLTSEVSQVSFVARDAETSDALSLTSTTVYDAEGKVIFPQDDGTYLLARGKDYKAIVTRLGYEDAVCNFTVGNNESETIDMLLAPAECTVTFRVVDEQGNAVNDANVAVTDATGNAKNPSASNALRFNLKAGSYTYTISAPGYETLSAPFNVSIESRTLTVVMTGTPQLVAFDITDATTHETLSGASVKVTLATSSTAIRPSADGTYLLAPGDYRYSVYCLGYESARDAFKVAGDSLNVAVELHPYAGASEGFAGGAGTVDDPYLIANEAQLRYLAQQTDIIRAQKTDADTNQKRTIEGYYQLVSDIELTCSWLPIGNYENSSNYVAFAGSFDGAGYTISGLNVTESDYDSQGLFGCVEGAYIGNLTVSGSVSGSSYVGGIVGVARFVSSQESGDGNAGATRIENCTSYVNVTGRYAVGGIVGSAQGSISSSTDFGTVVSKCSNYGTIQAKYQGQYNHRASSAGGIAGSAGSCKIEYSYNRAQIDAGYTAGGLVGQSLGGLGLFNSYNTGSVYEHMTGSGYAGTSGSIAGRLAKSSVANCYGLFSADEDAVIAPVGSTDSSTELQNYKMMERAEMWRNADFLALLNTDALTDTVSSTFVQGSSYPILKSEIVAGAVFAEEPYISVQPVSAKQAYKQGSEAQALTATSVAPTDGGTLSWQWYETEDETAVALSLIEGASGEGVEASFTPATDTIGTRYYLVVFTNNPAQSSGDDQDAEAVQPASVRSRVASVMVRSNIDAQEPVITAFNPTSAQQMNTTISAKVTTDVALSVSAYVEDDGTLSYQWYRGSSMVGNGAAIAGATSDTFMADSSSLGTTYYYVEITNTTEPGNATSVKSDWVAVTINQYTIETYEELLSFRTAVNSGVDFEGLIVALNADINVSAAAWEPIGTLEHPFRGTFSGANGQQGSDDVSVHTISGIRVDGASLGATSGIASAGSAAQGCDNLGLFGVTEAATIKNIIVDGNITGPANRYAGLLVGRALSSSSAPTTIESCATTQSSSVEGKYGIGGLVGYGCTLIKDSANHATVTGRAFVPTTEDRGLDTNSYGVKAVGGVIGYAASDYVQGCYNTGAVSVEAIDASAGQKCAYYVGGVVGYGSTTTSVVSCFDTGMVSAGTYATESISFRPAGVCYAGAVVGYQVYDYLYNVHYLDDACDQGTNGSSGYDYAENHTLAYLKTPYFLGQMHDKYGFGDAFALSANGAPHLTWETDATTGNPLTDAAEPYIYDVTIDGIDDITSTWSTYFYQGEAAPAVYVWADQVQPQGGHLTYQWYARPVGSGDGAWEEMPEYAGACTEQDGHYFASMPISTANVQAMEYGCTITNTLDGATGVASQDNSIPILSIEIRENAGTFGLRDATESNGKDNPWVIETAEQLHFLAMLVNGETKMVGVADTTFAGQYISLANDVDLSGFDQWEPIGAGDSNEGTSFAGYFDGDNHAITGLQIGTAAAPAPAADYQALFGSVTYGAVRNLCVSGTVNVGAGSWSTGGIVAYAYGTALENLANHVDVTGSVRVGGIAGTLGTSQVKDCVNTGTITVADPTATNQYGVGGIAGYAFFALEAPGSGLYNCLNSGTVSCTLAYGTDPRFGAIYGELSSGDITLSNCFYSEGTVSCLTDGSAGTGRGSSRECIEDEQGVCASFAPNDELSVAWLLNTNGGTDANSGRWGKTVYVDDQGSHEQAGLTLCGAACVYRVNPQADAAQISVSSEYACAGDQIGVSWRAKPGFVVKSVSYGAEGAETVTALATSPASFIMPASDIVFAVEADQDTRYRYDLSSAVVDTQGMPSDKATISFDDAGDAPTACEGDTIGVTISVEEGYQIKSVAAEGLFGTPVSIERIDGAHYQFVMPADLVCVTVTIEPAGAAADKRAASLDITKDNIHWYNSDDAYHTGNLLYDTVTLSGSIAGENQYVPVARMEGAYSDVTFYEQEYSVSGAMHRITGVPVTQFVNQYISDRTKITNDTLVTFETIDGKAASYTWEQLNALVYNSYDAASMQPLTRGLPVLLAFGQDGAPFTDAAIHVVFGQASAADDNASSQLVGVTRIIVGDDVNYAQHVYAPYDNLSSVGGSDVVVNIYQGDEIQSSHTYTVKDIEALANADKAGIYRGLYSTLVYEDDETSYSGPFSDFYEGYSLYDVLVAAGLPANSALANPQAKVQFYQKGGWDTAWKTVSVSLGYLAGNGEAGVGDYSNNFTMYGREDGSTSDGVAIYGMAPMLAYGKNNLPLVYASGSSGASALEYNYRGPLLALLPQNQVEGGYVADQTVSACYLGQIDVYLPSDDEPRFSVADGLYTTASQLKLVTYAGEVSQGQCVSVAGKKMFPASDGTYRCLLPASVADALTNASFTVEQGESPVYSLGDANANGTINTIDVQIAYDVACGVYQDFSMLSEAGWLACDMNADGVVDAADAFAIQNSTFEGLLPL